MGLIHGRASLAENVDRFVDRRQPPVFHPLIFSFDYGTVIYPIDIRRSPVFQPLGERLAFEVFHDQVGYGLGTIVGACYPEISDVDDVRMAQQSDGLRLSSEPLDEFAVSGQLRRNDFDGDATACAYVSRAIDRPHPAATATLLDLVLPVE